MTSTSTDDLRCIVEGEEKLPDNIGAETICSAIRRAAAPVLQGGAVAPAAVSVSVHVRSASGLSATPTVGGKTLRERRVAISDRALNARTVEMLANAVADEISTVVKQ